jgi:hypothetical protein
VYLDSGLLVSMRSDLEQMNIPKTERKMKPAKATVEIIMTILGPYLSAAHPLIYHLVSKGLPAQGALRGTYEKTNDTTSRSTVTETRLPRGGDCVSDRISGGGNTKPFQESS